jgi:hypothetical protein
VSSLLISRFCLLVLTGALLAVGLTACGGGGGGTNTSALKEAEEHGEEKKTEEEKESRLETEIQELKTERQQEKAKALRRQRQRVRARTHQESDGSSGGSQPAPEPAPAPESDIKSCGDELTATLDTTCEFAQNVENEYYEYVGSGGGYVEAYSPTLNETFSMYCTGSPHECNGALDAKVYFP